MKRPKDHHWSEMLLRAMPETKEGRLLALTASLFMGDPAAAHYHYKAARKAGATDTDLQNTTALSSQIAEVDLSMLAIETAWEAQEDEPEVDLPSE